MSRIPALALALVAAATLFLLPSALTAADAPGKGLTVRHDEKTGSVDVADGATPVLRYNFGTVPVPAPLKGRKYAEARSDYVHPLYGPDGEVVTVDYASDHPHHRGIYWAWPEVYYKGEKRDLHALQGVFARPSKLLRAEGGATGATIEAESIWKWGDTEPIVAERAIIRVHPTAPGDGRLIDFEFTFRAMVDGVAVARRGQSNYGGLNLRTNLHGGMKIAYHTDEAGATPRRSWGQIVGAPEGGKAPVAIAFLQHPSNPEYPGDWVQYPKIAWLQPTFPAKGSKFALSKDKPLVLKYRLWIRRGAATDEQLAAAWVEYSRAEDFAKPQAEKKR